MYNAVGMYLSNFSNTYSISETEIPIIPYTFIEKIVISIPILKYV